ncbi:MAG: Pr6Pr family membrane protein, partial [Anaerolineales bacterium]|nr:Pr6Pr family membrane protein [Anaerolineales bacterium]
MQRTNERQILLWTLLLSSFTGILIWYLKRLTAAPFSQWGTQTVELLSFFTNLTNLIVVIMAAALLFGRGPLHRWFAQPAVQAACCLYIAFVGLGFWFLLGGPQNVQTWFDWIPEITAHTLSPILGAIFWYRCVPKGQLAWRHAVIWLAYPIAYLVYWLFRGPRVGYYPY